MRHTLLTIAALIAIALTLGVARNASAAGGTFTIQCGSGGPVTVTKPNDNAAIYTASGTTYITAIGNIKTGGTAQSVAQTCTLAGDGFSVALPFMIING
ncbi:MAG: hypothetical protein M3P18_16060 [Actinomycetota bacterium]|nr:hypothetical protein [Actinomycetota bacterium]